MTLNIITRRMNCQRLKKNKDLKKKSLISLEFLVGLVLSAIALYLIYLTFSNLFFNHLTDYDIAKMNAQNIENFIDSASTNLSNCFYLLRLYDREFRQSKALYFYLIDNKNIYIIKNIKVDGVPLYELLLNEKANNIDYKEYAVKKIPLKSQIYFAYDETSDTNMLNYLYSFLGKGSKNIDIEPLNNAFIIFLENDEGGLTGYLVNSPSTSQIIEQKENIDINKLYYSICKINLDKSSENDFMNLIDDLGKYCSYTQNEIDDWKGTVSKFLKDTTTGKTEACNFIFNNIYQPCSNIKQGTYSNKIDDFNSYKFDSNYLYLFVKNKKKYIFLSNVKNTHIVAYLNLCSVLQNELIKNKKEEENKVKNVLSNEKKISMNNLNSINLVNYIFTIKASSPNEEYKETFFWDIDKNPSGTCNGCDSSFKSVSCNSYKSYTSCFIAFRNSIQNYELVKHPKFNSIYIVNARYRTLNDNRINKNLLFNNILMRLQDSEDYSNLSKNKKTYFPKNNNNLLKVASTYLLKKNFIYLGTIELDGKNYFVILLNISNRFYYTLTSNVNEYNIEKVPLINTYSYNFKVKSESDLNNFIKKIGNFVSVNNNYFFRINLDNSNIIFNNQKIKLNTFEGEDLSDNSNKVEFYWFNLYGKIFIVSDNWINSLKKVNNG